MLDLQQAGEKPIDALKRLARGVYSLSDEKKPLLVEVKRVAAQAFESERWGAVKKAMVNKKRGARGSMSDAAKKEAEKEAWRLICNTMVDELLVEVEDKLGSSVVSVDGRKPDWIKLIVKGTPTKVVETKLIGKVLLNIEDIDALGGSDIDRIRSGADAE